MSPRRGLLALLLLCSIVVTACGGDNTISARAAAPRLTKETYIEQANAICTKMNDAIAALGDPEEDATIDQYAESIDQWTEIVGGSLRELRALPAPTGDEVTLRTVYAKVDTLLVDAIALRDALRVENMERAEELSTKIDESTDAANAASIAYGLTVCGE
jgi:hypothetical protein